MNRPSPLLPLALLLACSCHTEFRLRRIDDATWFQRESRTALEAGTISERTRQYLRREGLFESYREDPAAVLEELHERLLANREREVAFYLAELCYQEARRSSGKYAARFDLSTVRYAYAYLFDTALAPPATGFDPMFRWACDFYNRSLAQRIDAEGKSWLAASREMTFPTLAGEVAITAGRSEYGWEPRDYEQILTTFHFEAVGIERSSRSYGLGVPLILVRPTLESGTLVRPAVPEEMSQEPDQSVPLRQSFAATAILRFEGSIVEARTACPAALEVYDPSSTLQIQIEGREVPLETDFTTPLAYALSLNQGYSGLRGLLHADESTGAIGLIMLEPYDPDKIPVVFVHGLLSKPQTWVYLLNDLLADAELRQRFQFWFFRYPTGNPIALSASMLRDTLLEVARSRDPEGKSRAFQDMVVCGHSMGGLLTRLQILDGGDHLWNDLCDTPLDDLDLPQDQRDLLHHVIYFQHLPFVKRVIFMATPHRGAELATGYLGRLGARMISLPQQVVDVTRGFGEKLKRGLGVPVTGSAMTGIGGLAPDSILCSKVGAWPLPAGLPVHSIIGNKKAADVPGGSDGLVPYESSHLEGVESEKIVKSGHSVQEQPEAIQEVRRILHEHLAAFDAAAPPSAAPPEEVTSGTER